MKKKLCIALSVIMIMLTLFSPMAAWAEPEGEGQDDGTQTEEPAQPEQPEKQDTASQDKDQSSSSGTQSSKSSSSKKSVDSNSNRSSSKKSNADKGKQYYPGTEDSEKAKKESRIEEDTISIIMTSDIHSHLDQFRIRYKGHTKLRGGAARLATIFDDISPDYRDDSYVLDAGDFSMGTAYQAVFEKSAAELRMMGYLGYDMTTIGNHEFDYGAEGLANMLRSAKKLSRDEKYDLPAICLSNVDWEKALSDPECKDGAKELQSALKDYGYEESYKVIKKNGTKIAVFGLFGKEAEECTTDSSLYFKDQVETAKQIVADIQKNEKKIDLIVCLSHCGVFENKDESEDEILAKEVPDIDLIVSGHSHDELEKPIVVGDTVIAGPGCFTQDVAHVTFKKDKSNTYRMDEYKLIVADSSFEEDKSTLAEVKHFKELVNKEYFSKFGYEYDEVIAQNDIDFTAYEDIGTKQGEDTLGNLLADSYVYSVEKIEGRKGDDVDVAIVPVGVIRSSFAKGDITAGDAFGILSTGKGEDGLTGYPLVSAYVTGKELKNIAEVDATVSDMFQYAMLHNSGLTYKINPNRLKLNRAFDIKLGNGKDLEEIDNDKLYRVVTDMYTAKMLATVNGESKGLLTITPKNKDGSIVIDFRKNIIMDGKKEVKAWYAVAKYLDHMNTVSSEYRDVQGRKVISDSKNLFELISQPNKMGWIVRMAVLVPLFIILLILLIIFIRRHRRRSNMMFSISERQKKAIFAPPKRQKNLFANNDRRRRKNRRNGRF